MSTEADFLLENYTFTLPEEQIAQEPAAQRTHSRLMVLNRKENTLQIDSFNNLATYLPPQSLIVINNSKVIPARVTARRSTGGQTEFLLLSPLPLLQITTEKTGRSSAQVTALLKGSKRISKGEQLELAPEKGTFCFIVEEKLEFGKCIGQLIWKGNLTTLFQELGSLPLPPYIRRKSTQADTQSYQTVYARDDKQGSVAAPTAGLHFTKALQKDLITAGHTFAEVTLYVGYGTFSPIRCHDIRQHSMHAEYIEILPKTAQLIHQARQEKRPILAVGTTAARTLETAGRRVYASTGINSKTNHEVEHEWLEKGYSGWTDIFLYPGQEVHIVKHLITNFHLPESSLLLLVAAIAGRENILAAYDKAVQENFRFFSYGDAMFII